MPTGTLNADGSFTISGVNFTERGVFATEGGHTIVRDGAYEYNGCSVPLSATKQ
jgi:hypothetical protein